MKAFGVQYQDSLQGSDWMQQQVKGNFFFGYLRMNKQIFSQGAFPNQSVYCSSSILILLIPPSLKTLHLALKW